MGYDLAANNPAHNTDVPRPVGGSSAAASARPVDNSGPGRLPPSSRVNARVDLQVQPLNEQIANAQGALRNTQHQHDDAQARGGTPRAGDPTRIQQGGNRRERREAARQARLAPRRKVCTWKTKPTLRIATQNMNGIGDGGVFGPRWSNLFRYMKEEKIAVVALQETHLSEDDIEFLSSNESYQFYASSLPGRETSAAGVAWLINKRIVSLEGMNHKVIIPGRATALTLKWHKGTMLTLLNLYTPSDSDEHIAGFFKNVLNIYRERNNLKKPDIVLGDFNMVEEGQDRSTGTPSALQTREALDALKEWMFLEDSHLGLYPDSTAYTFRHSSNPNYWARLDRMYIKHTLADWVTESRVEETGVGSDHRALITTMECRRAPYIGKGRWKMTERLIKSKVLTQKIEQRGIEVHEMSKRLSAEDAKEMRQLMWAKLKSEFRTMARKHDKATKPRKDEQDLRELSDRKNFLMNTGELSLEDLEEIDEQINKLTQDKHNRHRKANAATDFAKGDTPGAYMTRKNQATTRREIMYRMRRIPDKEVQRAARLEALKRATNNSDDVDMELDEADETPEQNTEEFIYKSALMAEDAALYHEELQLQDLPASPDEHQQAINDMKTFVKAKLTEAQSDILRARVTADELIKTLRRTKKGSAPGPDGIPYEWYSKMHERYLSRSKQNLPAFDVMGFLAEVFQNVEEHGHNVDANLNGGTVNPIFKKGDADDIKNYRPITLLNADYKIYTKWRAMQLAEVIHHLVPDDQTGFIPKRSIMDNITLTKSVIEYGDVFDEDGAIVLLDQEKAYDKINLTYLWAIMREYGLPEEFIKPVESLYAEASSTITINGVESQPFKVYRGVRQGDPLSCLLFVLAIEPLAELLRQSELKGYKHPDGITKLIATLFADDTTVYLDKEDDFATLTAILQRWCRASGARFNIAKTEVIPVGSLAYRQQLIRSRRMNPDHAQIPHNIAILPDGAATRSLGARIGNNISEEDAWMKTVDKIDSRIKPWSERNRYPELSVRKMYSTWIHDGMTQFMIEAQGIPDKIAKSLQKSQLDLIWAGKKGHTINQATLELPWSEGGINLTNQEARIEAIALKRMRKYIGEETRPAWAPFVDKLLAKKVSDATKKDIPEEMRILEHAQTWKIDGRQKLSGLPEIQASIKAAQKYGLRMDVKIPSQKLKMRMPLWRHGTITFDIQQDRNEWYSHHRGPIAQCLLRKHKVKTIGDLISRIERRAALPANRAHENSRSCLCNECSLDRRRGCRNPAQCHNSVMAMRALVAKTRWNPETPDPVYKNIGGSEEEEKVTGIPRSMLSEDSIGGNVRIFTEPQPKLGVLEKATHEQEARLVETLHRQCARLHPEHTTAFVKVELAARVTDVHDEHPTRIAAMILHDPVQNVESTAARIPDNRTQGATKADRTDPLLPLVIAAVKALATIPEDYQIDLATTSQLFVERLTIKKRQLEDSGLLHTPNADAWRLFFWKHPGCSNAAKASLRFWLHYKVAKP